jgi:O-acetyl-ADP-ribose deacetylase (regulator of RNase III)
MIRLKLELIFGDITKVATDAIVNAANSSLMGGGGVDGAIHRAGGTVILDECRKIIARQGKYRDGDAIITGAGNLKSKFVIHTVGPVWRGGKNKESELLAACYTNSLALAVINQCKSIAFPNIGTGAFGFPKDKAADIAIRSVSKFLQEHDQIQTVLFVCYEQDNYDFMKALINKI